MDSSAIPDSQQPISPIGLLFLKLPPPPCAVLLVYIYIYIFIYCIFMIHTYILTHLHTYILTYILTYLHPHLILHYIIYIYLYIQILFLHIVPTYCVYIYIYTYCCFPSRFVPSISHQAKLQGWLQRRKERPPAAPLRLDLVPLVPLAPLAAPVVKLGEEKDRRRVMMKHMKSYIPIVISCYILGYLQVWHKVDLLLSIWINLISVCGSYILWI